MTKFDIETYWLPKQRMMLCMCCGDIVRVWDEDGRQMNTKKWIKRDVAISDGTMVTLKLCIDCKDVEVDSKTDSEITTRIHNQIMNAYENADRLEAKKKFSKVTVLKGVPNGVSKAIERKKLAVDIAEEEQKRKKRSEDSNEI